MSDSPFAQASCRPMATSSPCVDLAWFVALPDDESGEVVAERLRQWGGDELHHCSGRPWLLGRWAPEELTLIAGRTSRVALIGQHDRDLPHLRRAVERAASIADIAAAADRLAGSFHALISVPGTVVVRGTLLGLRAVFYTTVSRCTVTADRADVLASLAGRNIEEEQLALHLLQPPALPPVTDATVWRGVCTVPPDHRLVIRGRQGVRLERRWSAPEPTRGLREGGAELRRHLQSAVAVRTAHGRQVSCDLAGLDSTSICSILARNNTSIVAITAANTDPTDDDMLWARRTLSGLDNVTHEVIVATDMPLPYTGLLDPGERFDEPCSIEVNYRGVMAQMHRAVRCGSVLHFNGFGGDELLQGSLAHLHSMARSSRYEALRRLRVFKIVHRWSVRRMLHELVDRTPYWSWLDRAATQLTGNVITPCTPLLGWSLVPQLPPWVTPDVHDALRRRIKAAAATAEPLAPDRGRHFDLLALRAGARSARQYDQLARRAGVPIAAPFYDDAVVDAGLSVAPAARITPWQYKPLITEAMRGIVPPQALTRATKAHWTCAQQSGLRAHRTDIATLANDSALDRLGIIDADVLRAYCSGPLPPEAHPGVFDQTVACERWLRSVLRRPVARSDPTW